MTARKKPETLADKVKRYFRIQDSIDRGYKRSDKLFKELLLEMEPGQKIPISEFQNAVLEDNFAKENHIFRPKKVCRFELKKVKA